MRCDGKADTSRPSDQIMSAVTTEDNTCPIIWVRRSYPRLRAHAVGMSNTPTTAISNQLGPGERGSGRARNNNPTESSATMAGQRGSKCLEASLMCPMYTGCLSSNYFGFAVISENCRGVSS
jgi:hypothetical protein